MKHTHKILQNSSGQLVIVGFIARPSTLRQKPLDLLQPRREKLPWLSLTSDLNAIAITGRNQTSIFLVSLTECVLRLRRRESSSRFRYLLPAPFAALSAKSSQRDRRPDKRCFRPATFSSNSDTLGSFGKTDESKGTVGVRAMLSLGFGTALATEGIVSSSKGISGPDKLRCGGSTCAARPCV